MKLNRMILHSLGDSELQANTLYVKVQEEHIVDEKAYNPWNFHKAMEGLIRKGLIGYTEQNGIIRYRLTKKGEIYLETLKGDVTI